MASIDEARALVGAGRFGEALAVLSKARISPLDRIAADLLRAELLERVGQYDEARRQAHELFRSRRMDPAGRSGCCLVFARVESLAGRADSSITWLQRAISFAEEARSDERASWAKLRLMVRVAEYSGFEAAASVLSDARACAIRTGDPAILAAVHLYVAQTEAKRGLLASPRRHVRLAVEHLKAAPNVWLDAVASHIETALAIMSVNFADAVTCGKRAVELAEQSGVADTIVTCVGTLAHVYFMTGDFASAASLIEWSAAKSGAGSDHQLTSLESLARIRLLEQRLDDCADLLTRADDLNDASRSSLRYVHRHILLTRAELLAYQRRWSDALTSFDVAISLEERTSDQLFAHTAALKKAEVLSIVSRGNEALAVIAQSARTVSTQPIDVQAMYQRALGCLLHCENEQDAAASHHARARRIFQTLHHRPGLIEHDWLLHATGDTTSRPSREEPTLRPSPALIVEGMAATLQYGDRPELIAREIAELAWMTGQFTSVNAMLKKPNDESVCLVSRGNRIESREQRLTVGTRDGEINVAFTLNSGVEPVAVFEAIRVWLQSLRQLHIAKAEREERSTLWPAEDLPIEGDRSVISGHMRELMNYARRIAKAKVNVLITGESGTGKEILARAIHDFSDRAKKPFVPFNCTAVPRDLLESQLFGHRRGAFIGADRDHVGLIRSAREGTLFLDEIGELSLDMQPKLLRFLESGEIAPLGEPGPLTIDVRIVAATNTNLEDAVRSGRFREDLFYRINVVRLSLRPLRERRDEIPTFVNHFVAQTAAEYGKGHLTVAEETMERLLLYRWPGNVRQLHNEIRRIVALAEPHSTIGPDAIDDDILGALPVFRRPGINGNELSVSLHAKLPSTIARIECEMIRVALKEHGGKVNAVAKALGISRKGLYLKRQRLGL